jgi:hypothetical protein
MTIYFAKRNKYNLMRILDELETFADAINNDTTQLLLWKTERKR